MEQVRHFHERYGFKIAGELIGSRGLAELAQLLADLARGVPQVEDASVRAHLVLEETAELVQALASGDRLAALDAVADLLYVTLGTAVTFDLPIVEAFDEVHVSNMTKTVEQDRPGHPGKGSGYRPPDLRRVLTAHDAKLAGVST